MNQGGATQEPQLLGGPKVEQARPCLPPPSQPTLPLETRVSETEMRSGNLEARVLVAEHVCLMLINEVNNLREQVGMAQLDHTYFQP